MNSLEVKFFRDEHNRIFVELHPSDGDKFSVEDVKISIYNKNNEKYLVGIDHWHGEEHFFGPCPVKFPEKVYFGANGIFESLVENSYIRIKAGELIWEGTFQQSSRWNSTTPDRNLWAGNFPKIIDTATITEPTAPEQIQPIEPEPPQSSKSESNSEDDEESDIETEVETDPDKNYTLMKVLILILLVVSLAISLWYFGILDFLKQPEIDPVTQCPVKELDSKTIVLIDGTDEIPIVYKQKLNKLCLNKFVNKVPEDGLLELRLMLEREKGGKIQFSKCNSESPSWRDSFNESLEQTLDMIKKPTKPQRTPLLETIQLIARDHIVDTENSQKRRIVIVSDMIEDTENFSHYDGKPFYERLIESGAAKRFQTSLMNTEVEICLIGRENSDFNALELVDFWDLWVERSGGVLNRQGAR